jgi:hypothetical protein
MGSIARLVLRYTMHAVAAAGISSEGMKAEFEQDAKEEQEHMMAVAERNVGDRDPCCPNS